MQPPRRFTITLTAKRSVARNTVCFDFTKPAALTFRAGQFATVRIPSLLAAGRAAEAARAFSFASAPEDNGVSFAWRRSESAFKQVMDALEIGEAVEMIAPAGHAVVPEEGRTVFLIGGIGITPVRSALRHALAQGLTPDWTLLYSNRTSQDAPFFDELRAVPEAVCRIVHTMTEVDATWDGERGFIDAAMVRRHVAQYADATYYLVGTSGFVHAMEAVVAQLGVPHERILCDNFG